MSLSECCVSGHVHAHGSTGEDTVIAGWNAYLAKPTGIDKAPTAAIVIATDIFGHVFPNTRKLADAMAAAGFLVAVPDLFGGDALAPNALNNGMTPAIQEWIAKHSNDEHQLKIINSTIDELRASHGISKIGVVGYCWGGRYTLLCAATDRIQAYAVAHPSRVKVPEDIVPLKQPGFFALAEKDHQFTAEHIATTEALKPTLPPLQMKQYAGTAHGFAVRGSPDDPVVAAAAKDALEETIKHFTTYLLA